MKSPILEQSWGSTGSAGNGGSGVRADLPPTRAGGQDDGSLPNSLKSLMLLLGEGEASAWTESRLAGVVTAGGPWGTYGGPMGDLWGTMGPCRVQHNLGLVKLLRDRSNVLGSGTTSWDLVHLLGGRYNLGSRTT